jgi:hypothetical protein
MAEIKQPFKTDISVLLLFHARADHFSKVWTEVKKARPARLFLFQDGARMTDKDGREVSDWTESRDYEGIMALRELVSDEHIDWQCEVHRNYQERNYGCDPSEYLSQRWAFSLTDKCIVLEDDDVPSQSFFPFCKEMLDRYEHDERITMIAGFNTDETSPTPLQGNKHESYFFTRVFSIWGWASWARVVNNWDGDYNFVNDPKEFALLGEKVKQYRQRKDMTEMCVKHSKAGKEFYESIFWAYMLLHDGLAIMPSVNMISNIGLEGGTHYSTQLDLVPKRLRRIFTMKRLELDFPLIHPSEIREYPAYQDRHYLRNAWNNPWRKVQYSLEELWLNLKAGNVSQILQAAGSRIKKSF